ncbi:MAG: DUF4209 domain-containing protein [Nocardioides sp.]|uniref:DUF4209 domain-containing protein n=1 Tax=Nocardioides sp. TaxID=35761 RepID=UPI0039E311D9
MKMTTRPTAVKRSTRHGGQRLTDSADARNFEPAELLHEILRNLAEASGDEFGIESLRARTLTAMARVTSAMLNPDSRDDPFAPAMRWSGRRTVVPSDLDDDELKLLADALPFVEQAVLKARLADVVWTYRVPRDPATAVAATDGYLAIPLTWDTWVRTGHDSYRRVVQLARSQGKPGGAVLDTLTARLVAFISTGDEQGHFRAQVSQVLRTTGKVTKAQSLDLGKRLSELAADNPAGSQPERALLREAAAWYHRAGEDDGALTCQVRIANSYAAEAEQRMHGDRGAMAASGPLEQSIEVLRELPRTYRDAHGLEEGLATRRSRLRELRQHSLEEMTPIRSQELDDIYEWVERARQHVSGRERFAALVALTGVSPMIDLDEQTEAVREYLADSLMRLFSRTTLSSDARKVGARTGDATMAPMDDEVLEELVRRNTFRIGLIVQALIVPAVETLSDEHRFDLAFVETICRESSTVPMRHAGLWARGLWHGLSGDFPSAVSILIPQIEQMVRLRLKNEGVHTLYIGDGGVETEKALGALLDIEQAIAYLGPNLCFELRALLLEQVGPNLRNELAHGLVTDGVLWGAPSIYAWWLCLRMALAPFEFGEDPAGDPEVEPRDEIGLS